MPNTIASMVAKEYGSTHKYILTKVVADLTDAHLAWRPDQAMHSIGFLLWHLARWADALQTTTPGMTSELRRQLGVRPQIWEAEGLASQWGWVSSKLGYMETGMEMDHETATRLPLPPKDILLDYVRRAFAAAEDAIAAIDDEQFVALEQPQFDDQTSKGLREYTATVGGAIISHTTHDALHLGVIQYLRGLQGLPGTGL
jgi:DinB superfamily